MFESLTDSLVSFGQSVLDLLPQSPLLFLEAMSNTEVYDWLKMLNWFIPINSFISVLEVWLTGVLLYYIYQVVLRWIKVIE